MGMSDMGSAAFDLGKEIAGHFLLPLTLKPYAIPDIACWDDSMMPYVVRRYFWAYLLQQFSYSSREVIAGPL